MLGLTLILVDWLLRFLCIVEVELLDIGGSFIIGCEIMWDVGGTVTFSVQVNAERLGPFTFGFLLVQNMLFYQL